MTEKSTPRLAKTFDQICKLKCDHADTNEHWISVSDDSIYIVAQRNGESPTQEVVIPRKTFDAFIDWYNTGTYKRPR